MFSILNVVPFSNQKVFAPTAARAMVTAHEDPFNTLEPNLWTSGFIGLRLGKIVNSGFKGKQWPSEVDPESAFESSFFHGMVNDVLEKAMTALHNHTKNHQIQFALTCKMCLLKPFEQHVQRHCLHSLMRRAGVMTPVERIKSFQELIRIVGVRHVEVQVVDPQIRRGTAHTHPLSCSTWKPS